MEKFPHNLDRIAGLAFNSLKKHSCLVSAFKNCKEKYVGYFQQSNY